MFYIFFPIQKVSEIERGRIENDTDTEKERQKERKRENEPSQV